MVDLAATVVLRGALWAQVLAQGVDNLDTNSLAWQLLVSLPGTMAFVLMTIARSAGAALSGFVAARRGGNLQVGIVLGLVIASLSYFTQSARYPHWSQAVAAALIFASAQIGAYIARRNPRPT